jgi:hypothetical protein
MEDDMAGAIGGGLPAVVAWKQLEKTGEQQRARWEKQPSVQREVAYAKDFASKVKNVEELINNRRFMNFALSAFGLESEVDKKGLLRKVLLSDLTDQNSYANRMNDPRFQRTRAALESQGRRPHQRQERGDAHLDRAALQEERVREGPRRRRARLARGDCTSRKTPRA